MAVDSIIARPSNRVRVIVAEASGCCASAVRAVATARPSPRAGHMHPMPVVKPAVTIEAIAMRDVVSMESFGWFGDGLVVGHRFGLGRPRGGGDVNRGEDEKDVGLHHAG